MLLDNTQSTVTIRLINDDTLATHTGVDKVSVKDGMYSVYVGDDVHRYSVYNIQSVKETIMKGGA